MRTNRARRNFLPKEAMGVSYEGILAPITDRGAVIGCMICTHSMELQEQNMEIAVRFHQNVSEMKDKIESITGA